MDIFSFVTALKFDEISKNTKAESSKIIRERIEKARKFQKQRYEKDGIYCNAQMNQKLLNKYCKLDKASNSLLEAVYNKYNLSNRAYSRILKLARTIADLSLRDRIESSDVVEAIQYRKFIDENIV